ncbi:MAG TPA: extracellular solute-binding protein [bacterium]|nr:extracellular solute-binding protein [bacterium]
MRPVTARPTWRTAAPRLVLAALVVLLALPIVGTRADAKPTYGTALGGAPKYPAGFTHFDYANPKAPRGGTLTLAAPTSFDTLNPFSLKGRGAPLIQTGIVFESLMDNSLDEPFSEYGLLAESIEKARDGLSVTFRINPRAKFADGRPVTAQDVVFSFNVLRSDAASPLYRYYYADVTSAQAVNRRTVRFRFRRKNRELSLIVGQLPVLPEHFYKGKDFGNAFGRAALGSGPYKVADFEFGRFVRYQRRPDYWGRNLPVNAGKYNFDDIVVKIYRDQTVQLEGLKAGEFDVMPIYSSKQWAVDVAGEKWDKHYLVKAELKHHNTAGMQGYVFNLRRPIFANREVRKALALAMDFQWSNENLFYGQYKPQTSYFDNSELAARGLPSSAELKLLEPLKADLPPEVFTQSMGRPLGDGLTQRQRLVEAKRLLNANGWQVRDGVLTNAKTGQQLRFTVTLVQPAFERVTEPYLNNLRRLGVQATMKTVDSSVYEGLVRTFDYDMIVDSFGQSQSPGNEQRDYWSSASARQQGGRNTPGIENKAIDTLVDDIVTAKSRKDLVTATHALDRALWYGYYVVPQWYIDVHRVTFWNKFGRPQRLPLYYSPTSFLMFWWQDHALADALQKAMAAGKPLVWPQ